MIVRASSTEPGSSAGAGRPVVLAGLVGALVLMVAGPAAAAQQPEERVFAITAWTCPTGYEDVAYAEDCAEPLADFAFDVAGPIDAEETTDEDGRADFGEVPLGGYAIEALDFDADDGFVVLCDRPTRGGPLPADIEYTDAGFEIDLAAEFERDLPPSPVAEDGVTCAWYALPDPPDDRPGIVGLDGRRCDQEDAEPAVEATEPGGGATEIAGRRFGCDAAPVTVTLVDDETGEETAVDVAADPDAEPGYTLSGVPAGSYTATAEGAEASVDFEVFAGETTVVLVVVEAPTLDVSFEPNEPDEPEPTATAEEPEPTATAEAAAAEPEPLDPIAFGPGDWQDAFPNINEGVYDRAAVALYGAFSPFPSASLRFELPAAPAGNAVLTIEGLGDEIAPAQITVTVNGTEVFRGESGFAGWDPSAASPAWTPVDFAIPAGLLQEGDNEITVANLTDSAAVGLPPYVLLSTATLTFEV